MEKIKKVIVSVILSLLTVVLVTQNSVYADETARKISISTNWCVTLASGESSYISVQTEPYGEAYTLTSANPAIATVSESGEVTGVSKGVTVVYAALNDGSAKTACVVCVDTEGYNGSSSSEDYSIKNSVNLHPGESEELYLYTSKVYYPREAFEWSSSNTDVVTVDNNGTIKAIAPGTATIMVKPLWENWDYVYSSSKCIVNVTSDIIEIGENSIGGKCGDNLIWKLTEEGDFSITGTGPMISVPWAEYQAAIKTINIGEGVTTIADFAFSAGGNGESIYGDETTLKLPSTLTYIGKYAFYGRRNLVGELVIPNLVTTVGDYAFYGCHFTGDIILPEGLTQLGNCVFYCMFDGKIELPSTLTEVASSHNYNSIDLYSVCNSIVKEFINNSNISVALSSSDYYIWVDELGNEITEIANGRAIKKIVYSEDDIFIGDSGKCGDSLYWNLSPEGTLTIMGEGEMTSAPWRKYASHINKLDMHEGMTTIYFSAFGACSNVKSVSIPNTVKIIQGWAFSGCTGIQGLLNIPKSVESIESRAFGGCTGLTGDVILPEGIKYLSEDIFNNCSNLNGKLVIPSTLIGQSEYSNNEDKTINNILGQGTAITTIVNNSQLGIKLPVLEDDYWVYEYEQDKPCYILPTGTAKRLSVTGGSIDITESGKCGENLYWYLSDDGTLTIVGEGEMTSAFGSQSGYLSKYKYAIRKLVLGKGITKICDDAFRDCVELKGDIVIPEGVKIIGARAFLSTQITGNLVIPESLEVIGGYAFCSCYGLNGELILPSTLKYVSENAFNGCINITKVINKSNLEVNLPGDTSNYDKWYSSDNSKYVITRIKRGTATKKCRVRIMNGDVCVSDQYVTAGSTLSEPTISVASGEKVWKWISEEYRYLDGYKPTELTFPMIVNHGTTIYVAAGIDGGPTSGNIENDIAYPNGVITVSTKNGSIKMTSEQYNGLQSKATSYIPNCSTAEILDDMVAFRLWDWHYYNQYYSEHPNTPVTKARVESVSLNVDALIGVNFYIEAGNTDVPKNIVLSGYEGSKTIAASNAVYADGIYKVTYSVPAKNMNDPITVKLLDAQGNIIKLSNESAKDGIFEYSVRKYLDSVSLDDNSELSTLAKAMKTYGLCSQKVLGYNAPSSVPTMTSVSLSDFARNIGGTDLPGIHYYGSSLLLKDKTIIRHYFSVDGAIDSYSFYVGDSKLTPCKYEDLYYVDISNIAAANLDKKYTLTVNRNNASWYISYSALSYCNIAVTKGKVDMTSLAYSMYWYNKAAKDYFNNAQGNPGWDPDQAPIV